MLGSGFDSKRPRRKLASNRILGGTTSVQEIAKRDGYENHKDFWLALLAKPLPASTYVFLLRSYHSRLDAPDMGALEMGFRAILKTARSTGLPWIFRDTQATAVTESKSLDGWMVYPRPATEWPLSMPTERPLVPEELRDFLEGRAPDTLPAKTPKRKIGRPARQMPRVMAEMRRLDRSRLEAMKQVEMETTFKANRDTCRRARKEVQSEIADG